MNLHQKLIEIRKTCKYLKKDNAGYQFQYVSSAQTLGTLRDAMDEHAVLLVPEINAHEVSEKVNKKGGIEYFTELNMTFTWVNADQPEEQIKVPFYAQGLDNAEKGVGKALTYAEKYFLLKFFNIATDKDDPDAFQDRSEQGRVYSPEKDIAALNACGSREELNKTWLSLSPVAQNNSAVKAAAAAVGKKYPKAEPMTDQQRKAIMAYYSNSGATRAQRLEEVSAFIGHNVESCGNLTKHEAQTVLDRINRG